MEVEQDPDLLVFIGGSCPELVTEPARGQAGMGLRSVSAPRGLHGAPGWGAAGARLGPCSCSHFCDPSRVVVDEHTGLLVSRLNA